MTVRPNQLAPELAFDVLNVPEKRWDIREAKPEHFSLLIFYRGVHCPVCKKYLKTFEARFDDFAERGVELCALSMDDESRAERAVEEWELEKLPVGYGIDEATMRGWGLFISESIKDGEPRRFSEPGLFLVRADGNVHYAAINSMPFGRPQVEDILDAIDFIQKEDYPARGQAA